MHDAAGLLLLLAHGVTTARLFDGEFGDLRLKSSADSEWRPRLRVCSQVDGVSGVDDAVRRVARVRQEGFDRAENRVAGGMDRTRVTALAQLIARRGIIVGTTLNNYGTIGSTVTGGFDSLRTLPELAYVPERVRRRWLADDNLFRRRISPQDGARLLSLLYPLLEKLAREIVREGGTLLLGTDASWNLPFMVPESPSIGTARGWSGGVAS